MWWTDRGHHVLRDPSFPCTGVAVFDRLQANQKLALMAAVGEALRNENVPGLELTVYTEGTVAAVYGHILGMIELEIACEADPGRDATLWRRLVLTASRAVAEEPEEPFEEAQPTDPVRAAIVDLDLADPAGTRARVERARAAAVTDFSPEAFGRTWTDLLTGAVSQPAPEDLASEEAPSSGGELAALRIVARCDHARLCSCSVKNRVECQLTGKRPAETLSPPVFERCLAVGYCPGQDIGP